MKGFHEITNTEAVSGPLPARAMKGVNAGPRIPVGMPSRETGVTGGERPASIRVPARVMTGLRADPSYPDRFRRAMSTEDVVGREVARERGAAVRDHGERPAFKIRSDQPAIPVHRVRDGGLSTVKGPTRAGRAGAPGHGDCEVPFDLLPCATTARGARKQGRAVAVQFRRGSHFSRGRV